MYENRSGFAPRPRIAEYLTATLDGGTDEVLAAAADKAYQIYWLGLSNNGATDRVVSFKWGSGSEFLKFKLVAGANLLMNFVGAEFQGPKNTAFNGVLDDTGEVFVTPGYKKVDV